MNKAEFDKLIQKDRCQVFLFSSRAVLPWFFATHPWFVVNNFGQVSRWEIILVKNSPEAKKSLVTTGYTKPWQGSDITPFSRLISWDSKLINITEGDGAHNIAEFIEGSVGTYPYKHTYSFLGPNSNTYAQWILDQCPDIKANLPWNAFGKNYHN